MNENLHKNPKKKRSKFAAIFLYVCYLGLVFTLTLNFVDPGAYITTLLSFTTVGILVFIISMAIIYRMATDFTIILKTGKFL